MSYYQLHVFVCENRRDNGAECCALRPHADGALKYLRELLKAKDLHGSGKIRINRAGCFNRCSEGPILVVYPDGVWYRYQSKEDLQEIAEQHLMNGNVVERLRISDSK